MAKPNYRFDKRQREIKKSQKQEEKRLKKLAKANADAPTPAPDAGVPVKASSVYMLPGGCSHNSPCSLAVLGLVAGALLVMRRRRRD